MVWHKDSFGYVEKTFLAKEFELFLGFSVLSKLIQERNSEGEKI